MGVVTVGVSGRKLGVSPVGVCGRKFDVLLSGGSFIKEGVDVLLRRRLVTLGARGLTRKSGASSLEGSRSSLSLSELCQLEPAESRLSLSSVEASELSRKGKIIVSSSLDSQSEACRAVVGGVFKGASLGECFFDFSSFCCSTTFCVGFRFLVGLPEGVGLAGCVCVCVQSTWKHQLIKVYM